jgi:hypothetical protein
MNNILKFKAVLILAGRYKIITYGSTKGLLRQSFENRQLCGCLASYV